MKRALRPEEQRLWTVVAATVRPIGPPPRPVPEPALPAPAAAAAATPPRRGPAPKAAEPAAVSRVTPVLRPPPAQAPELIEPNRRRRIARGRDAIAARLDLHGYDQDHARRRLHDFLLAAQADGARAVLVITGKGFAGEGVLRRRAPEWLADPRLRPVVAGLSPAEAHHGGGGAWYVALKRKPR